MTQEQKNLLLKDLCGRLPHGVKCKILETNEVKILASIQYDGENTLFDFWENDQKIQYGYQLYLSEFKPYLLPISSMTEEQYNEMQTLSGIDCLEHIEIEKEWRNSSFNHLPLYQHRVIEFFHKHRFDYRGLIPMRLANDATNKNIY